MKLMEHSRHTLQVQVLHCGTSVYEFANIFRAATGKGLKGLKLQSRPSRLDKSELRSPKTQNLSQRKKTCFKASANSRLIGENSNFKDNDIVFVLEKRLTSL